MRTTDIAASALVLSIGGKGGGGYTKQRIRTHPANYQLT